MLTNKNWVVCKRKNAENFFAHDRILKTSVCEGLSSVLLLSLRGPPLADRPSRSGRRMSFNKIGYRAWFFGRYYSSDVFL